SSDSADELVCISSSDDEALSQTTTVDVETALPLRSDDNSNSKAAPASVSKTTPAHSLGPGLHNGPLSFGDITSSRRMQQVPGKEKIGMMRLTPKKATPIAIPQTMTRKDVASYRKAVRQQHPAPQIQMYDPTEAPPEPKPEPKPRKQNLKTKLKAKAHAVADDLEAMLNGLANIKLTDDHTIDTPAEMTISLKQHQREGVAWMRRNEQNDQRRGGILGDDMGLGKTIQALALMVAHKPRNNGAHGTLIVAPMSTLNHWKCEAETRLKPGTLSVLVYHGSKRADHAESLPNYDLVITSIGVVSSEWGQMQTTTMFNLSAQGRKQRDAETLELAANGPLFRTKWRRIVIDEAHELKNRKSNKSMACCDLVGRYRWCLSGTPIQNSVEDVYSLLRFLRVEPYCRYSNFQGLSRHPDQGLSNVRSVLEAIMLRRRKATVSESSQLQLPARFYYIHRVDLSPAERLFYNRIALEESLAADSLGNATMLHLLQMLLRLRQATSHPSIPLRSGCLSQDCLGIGSRISLNQSHIWSHTDDAVRKLPVRSYDTVDFCAYCRNALDFSRTISVHRCGMFVCHRCTQNDEDGCACDMCVSLGLASEAKRPGDDFVVYRYMGRPEAKVDAPLVDWFQRQYMSESPHPSTKMKRILAILRSADKGDSNDKTVVFTEHLSALHMLSQYLASNGFPNLVYHGALDKPKRDRALDEFGTNKHIRVLLVSKKAGAVGINLIAANHVIIESLWWNPAVDNQAVDRVFRIGQIKQVHVHLLIARDTVDEKMFDIQEEKRRLINAVISDDSAADSAKLNRTDLMNILRRVWDG
ncbi:hypothetical protein IWW54_001101, partial [Coemansia sp. RSA 2705]